MTALSPDLPLHLAFLRNWRIARKLVFGFGMLLAVVAATIAIGLLGIWQVGANFRGAIDEGLAISGHATQAKSALLQARRLEKDFFLRWQVEGFDQAQRAYLTKHRGALAQLREHLHAIEDLLTGLGSARYGELHDELQRTGDEVSSYAGAFQTFVALIARRGHWNSGQENSFRNHAHALEQALARQSSAAALRAELLELRRHEKDYLLRRDAEYIESVHAQLSVLRLRFDTLELPLSERAELSRHLDRYLSHFDLLVDLDAQIARQEDIFRDQAHRIETTSDRFLLLGTVEGRRQVLRARTWERGTLLVVGVGLLLLFCCGLLLAVLLSRHITVPMQLLADTADQIDAGKLDVQAPVVTDDEVGDLSETFNAMTERLARAEAVLKQRMDELEAERQRSEGLLLNVLPRAVAERLKRGERTISDQFVGVTVLFADIVGFTPLAATMTADRVVDILNEVFSAFDEAADRLGVEKIKTIGDAYMAVAGLPERQDDHARRVVELALAMLDFIEDFNGRHRTAIGLRIGVHTGAVVAGIIGRRKFSYDLWGDTVNIASRLESHGVTGAVQVSRLVYDQLKDAYTFEPRGSIELRGKGPMEVYLSRPRRA